MKFNQFLILEGRDESLGLDNYKSELTEEQVIEIIKLHCKNIDLDNPLYRGMGTKTQAEYMIIEGQKGGRQSQNTTNHYTLIIDKHLKDNYSYAPLRSKSIICTNSSSKAYKYGNAYVILPYDDTELGMCESEDIWDTEVSIGDMRLQLHDMNDKLHELIKNPKSYNDIVNAIVNDLKSDKPSIFSKEILSAYKELNDIDDEEIEDLEDAVESVLYDAYEPEHGLNMQFGTYKELDVQELDENHEFWIGGKVLGIKLEYWKSLLKKLK